MLLVAEKGREEEVFARLPQVGTGCGRRSARSPATACCACRHHGEVVAEIPNRELADEAPLYDRPHTKPLRRVPMEAPAFASRRSERAICRRCSPPPTSAPSAGSGSSTTTWCAPTRSPGPGGDAAIVRIKETGTIGRDVARWQWPLLLPLAARRREARSSPSAAAICRRSARCRWPPPTI